MALAAAAAGPDDPVSGLDPDEMLLGALDPVVAADVRADQEELIRTPIDRLLVIQGGPGTGKTVSALRRVAWLVGEGALSATDVLVIGPSAAFTRYTRSLLESWGHHGVDHCAIGALPPRVPGGRTEAPHVTRLKGEARMAGLLNRALRGRDERRAAELPATLSVPGREITLDAGALQRVVATARASRATPADRRRILRGVLAATGADPRLAGDAIEALAERIWPAFDPAGFLRDLFASPEWLTEAAGGEFTEREIAALYREAGSDDRWSDADLPLLDEAEQVVRGNPRQYAHVVVDEAQDLSPMQLRAVSRRSATGSMTIIGDMAQSTGPWTRDDWHDVLAHLPGPTARVHRELRYGYRISRQILDLAAELLPTAAPSVPAPTTVRTGPADPVIRPVAAAERAAAAVAGAVPHLTAGRSVAIVCPQACREDIEARLREEGVAWRPADGGEPAGRITVLSPQQAKGLQFEAAVVVEPGFIVDEDPRGHRLLYIALTRATEHLHLVGLAEDMPVEDGATDASRGPAPASRAPTARGTATVPAGGAGPRHAARHADPAPPLPLDPKVREAVNLVAHAMAETLLANLTPELWPAAMRRLAELVEPDDPPT